MALSPERSWVRRAKAAQILGIHRDSLRALQREGKIEFVMHNGQAYFDAEVLQKRARALRPASLKEAPAPKARVETERAIAAFSMFDGEASPADAAIALKIHPDDIEPLFVQWARLRHKGIVLRGEDLRAIENTPGMRGAFPIESAASLAESLRQSLSVSRCAECEKAPARYCHACSVAHSSARRVG